VDAEPTQTGGQINVVFLYLPWRADKYK